MERFSKEIFKGSQKVLFFGRCALGARRAPQFSAQNVGFITTFRRGWRAVQSAGAGGRAAGPGAARKTKTFLTVLSKCARACERERALSVSLLAQAVALVNVTFDILIQHR